MSKHFAGSGVVPCAGQAGSQPCTNSAIIITEGSQCVTEIAVNIHVLGAAYTPFSTFADWVARTSIDTVRWDPYTASLEKHSQAGKRATVHLLASGQRQNEEEHLRHHADALEIGPRLRNGTPWDQNLLVK